ncbi:LuxR C-terminal-related transcriptional regulator [Streptomyces sp. NPDC056061]|uniref:LuxR C-terminal-related transcriptional regulator n=1 Tax=Streptomyces sp. NPDC056061 TaxID=3345700 RepID=UPI0035E04C92
MSGTDSRAVRDLLSQTGRIQLAEPRTRPPVRIHGTHVVDEECCRALLRTYRAAPDSRTILLVRTIGLHGLKAVARLGISAVLLRAEIACVADVVARVAAGGHRLPECLRRQVLAQAQGNQPLARPDVLSPYEADVIALFAQGITTPRIARITGTTEHSVTTRISGLVTRLGVRSHSALASYARALHIV